jgi:NADH-quinone oxidoreductase subunit H
MIDLFYLVTLAVKLAFVMALMFGISPVLTWMERRQSAMMQDRVGPNRAGLQLPPAALKFRDPLRSGALFVGLGATGLGVLLAALWAFQPADALDPQPFWPAAVALGVGIAHVGIWRIFDYLFPPDGNIALFGLLHPLADVMKMIWKEDLVPPRADKFLHAIAPIIAVVPPLSTLAVIPFSDTFYPALWNQHVPTDGVVAESIRGFSLQVASVNVGILYIFAIAGTGIIGAAIAGYSSDNKYSLLGGIRAASQMVSYEVTLGLSLVGAFMVYDSLLLEDMVRWQHQHVWGIVVQPLAFLLFFTASTAESKRAPFDAPEGESEIVAGYFTEYSGMKWGIFMMGEFIELITGASLVTAIFLGGWDVPFLSRGGLDLPFLEPIALQHWAVTALQVLAFLVKLGAVLVLQMTVRWSLPRFRYDQIMKLCWRMLLPLSLANIFLTGIFILLLQR